MSHWQDLRRHARRRHATALAAANGDPSAAALVAAAAELTGVASEPVRAGHPLLDGGDAKLDIDGATIWYNANADPLSIPFYQAHEYAHHWLGHEPNACSAADLDAEAPEEPVPLGVQRIEGYGPQERGEREANVFAREFLLPAPVLRQWFLAEDADALTIADRTKLPEGMVLHQLAYALLAPDGEEFADVSATEPDNGAAPKEEPDLDASQRTAAHAECGPLLVEAGPGTGKTRTLVGRIVFLLDQGVPPASILALTFSNKAAEEMRTRVARVAPAAAPHIWMGTFHAFGLELLRKFGTRLGLPAAPRVLDPVEAFLLLERELPVLGLDHYQNLYEPITYLRDILGAISRAKDELGSPAGYTTLAAQMLAEAATAEAGEAANKALEVARVYTFYQERLDEAGWLDFGDLIARSVEMLRTNRDVRDRLRETYAHVLVDEYQDVNRASSVLLREFAGDGTGLWVVGDMRQAIYRFRGAAPSNVRRFGEDFPDAQRLTLARNYRSRPEIVEVVAALAPRMRAGGDAFVPWEPDRSAGGTVLMEIADDAAAEVRGLAREIERQQGEGIRYRDQAVLCRSHATLARIALGLEQAGVPVLYLGDLFERPEIRDLLALLELACGGDGRGLVRVARFPEYRIPLVDVRMLLALAQERDVPFPRALALARDSDALSPTGKEGLARLERHLEELCYGTSAWGLLAHYLFERGDYVRELARDDSTRGQQRRLAVYQFLQFAHERRSDKPVDGGDPKRAFLRYVRRLEIYGEEKQLRQVPEWASGLDAVRLLTVHASKGLEFDAVYVPDLRRGSFPSRRQYQPCPPPRGLVVDGGDDDHEEEEECLFFVALSRARDVLCLSRPRRYGEKASNPSDLLLAIGHCLPNRPDGKATWIADVIDATSATLLRATDPTGDGPAFDVEALDVYIACPRRYYYEFVLGLGGRREDAVYVLFHRCVYGVLRWLDEERAQGRSVTEAEALLRLAEIWEAQGPQGHAYEALYRERAEVMVCRALAHDTLRVGGAIAPTWEVPLRHGRVRITPDQVDLPPDGSAPIVRRLRTGRPPKDEDDNVYALYQMASQAVHPNAVVETLYLSSADHARPVALSAAKLQTRLDRYDAAIAGIVGGDFDPLPNDRECPRCPHYFICPLAEDV